MSEAAKLPKHGRLECSAQVPFEMLRNDFQRTQPTGAIHFDAVFDFVVVGSGGGSMCAALVMRDAGQSVLILEKSRFIGGTTARSGGVLWIPNNCFMKRAGIEDSVEKAMTYLDDVVGDDPTALGATRERRLKYVTEAPQMVDFLVRHGIKLDRAARWPDYYDERPGGHVLGRTVIAELFDVNQLGPWKDKLQPGITDVPASLPELLLLPFFKRSWPARWLMAKVVARTVVQTITGRKLAGAGRALQGRMLQAALQASVEFQTEAPARELMTVDGRVVGVLAQKDGKSWRIGAKLGVLVNAGGFARNRVMRDRYLNGLPVEWTSAADGDTGEMIEEMVRIGAYTAQMDEVVGNQTTPVPGFADMMVKPPIQGVTAKPHAILVDQSGTRYMNEGGSYMAYCKGMLERNRTVPAVPSWAIFDSQFLSKYMLAGTLPGRKKPKSWADEGYLQEARTLEDLARLLKIAPQTLKATVDRFNAFVDKDCDEDFGRGVRAYDNWLGDPFHGPSQTLGRIEKPPFYAVPVIPGDVGTFGGVVTDVHGRVLDSDGDAIPGLYATGVATASVMGRTYPGAGSSIGPSFVWGYVAARHALNVGLQASETIAENTKENL